MSEAALRQVSSKQLKEQVSKCKKEEDVTALSLCGGMWPGWEDLIRYRSLRHVDAVAMYPPLMTLAAPPMLSITMLCVNDNAIATLPNDFAQSFPKLRRLDLCNNRITSLEALQPLVGCTALRILDLSENEICKLEGYRASLLAMLPHLQFLDSKDREGQDADIADSDEGESSSEDSEDDGEEEEEAQGGKIVPDDAAETNHGGDEEAPSRKKNKTE